MLRCGMQKGAGRGSGVGVRVEGTGEGSNTAIEEGRKRIRKSSQIMTPSQKNRRLSVSSGRNSSRSLPTVEIRAKADQSGNFIRCAPLSISASVPSTDHQPPFTTMPLTDQTEVRVEGCWSNLNRAAQESRELRSDAAWVRPSRDIMLRVCCVRFICRAS